MPNAVDKHIKFPQVLLAVNGAAAVIGRIGLGFVSDWIGKVNVLKVHHHAVIPLPPSEHFHGS